MAKYLLGIWNQREEFVFVDFVVVDDFGLFFDFWKILIGESQQYILSKIRGIAVLETVADDHLISRLDIMCRLFDWIGEDLIIRCYFLYVH